ncbi:MAG: alcohol dehydrogenase catalytic domain-containing protein [Paracoccaceae bacterium]
MTPIQAAVCDAFHTPLEIRELHLRDPRPGELRVDLEAVAICHSDIAFTHGAYGGALPAVYGHEAAGRVTALGEGVRGIPLGARVVVTLIRSCRQCPTCLSGNPTSCEAPPEHGPPLTTPEGGPINAAMYCGAFAEAVVVDQSQVATVPEEVGPEAAALMACGVITGIGGVVHSARLRAGEDVVVIGAGGVGLNAIQGARLCGARRIVAVDLVEEKARDAALFGATDAVWGAEPWEQTARILGGGADVVVVAAGARAAYADAQRYLAPLGRLIMLGMPAVGTTVEYDPGDTAYCCHALTGSRLGETVLWRDIPWIADLYLQERLELDALVTGRWELGQINEAIADTLSGAARRNVIVFP